MKASSEGDEGEDQGGQQAGVPFRRCTRTEFEEVAELLNKQDAICVKLQGTEVTLADVDSIIATGRDILKSTITRYQCLHMASDYTKNKIGRNTDNFEIAVKKLQLKQPLSQREMGLLELLKKPVPTKDVEEAKGVDSSDEEMGGGDNGNEQNPIEMSPRSTFNNRTKRQRLEVLQALDSSTGPMTREHLRARLLTLY